MNTRESGRLVICVQVNYYLTLPLQRADRVEISLLVLLVLPTIVFNDWFNSDMCTAISSIVTDHIAT